MEGPGGTKAVLQVPELEAAPLKPGPSLGPSPDLRPDLTRWCSFTQGLDLNPITKKLYFSPGDSEFLLFSLEERERGREREEEREREGEKKIEGER